MTNLKTWLLSALLLQACASTQPQRPVTAWNFDWDDNIAYMPTTIVLFEKKTGQEAQVTTEDFAHIREDVGKKGAWKAYEIRGEDRQKGSFRNFSDQPKSNPFLDDLRKAVETEERQQWQGPSWEAFRLALSDPEIARRTTIITARGHSPEALAAGLVYLKEKGFLKEIPPKENLFAVSHERWKGAASSPSATKAKIMIQLLDDLEKVPVPAGTAETWSRNGDSKVAQHLWGFSDDDYGNYEAAFKILGPEVKKGRWPHVKITLFFTGFKKEGVRPHSAVIKNDGTLREKLADEQESNPGRGA
jgi:hypothetical protein